MAHEILSIKAMQGRLKADTKPAKAIQSQIDDLLAMVTVLSDLRTNPHEDWSESLIATRIDAARASLLKVIATAKNNAEAVISEQRVIAAGTVTAEAGLVQNDYAAEIRSVFRGMNVEQQTQLWRDAIAAKDGSTVAALTEAPAALTGLTAEAQSRYRAAFVEATTTSTDEWIDGLESGFNAIIQVADSLANQR